MKKSALIIPVAASGAALLLIAAAAKSHGAVQPDPYSVISWLAVILAFCVFAVMLAEYFIHSRRIHLYLSGTFLALGIMGIWDTLTFPYYELFKNEEALFNPVWGSLFIWEFQWITLAAMLMLGLLAKNKLDAKPSIPITAIVSTWSILWAAVIIFLMSFIPAISQVFAVGKTGMVLSSLCGVAFVAACFAYSRVMVHRNNAVLAWMAYGLVFAILAQVAMTLQEQPTESLLGFAGLMKVLVFLSPLAGMLAEHLRIQARLHSQASEFSNLLQTQHAVTSISVPDEVYNRIVNLAATTFSAPAVCLMLFDKERGLLRVAAKTGLDDDAANRLSSRAGEGPIGDSYSDKQTVFVRNIIDDSTLLQKIGTASEIRSAVFAPLVVRDESRGVLALFFGGRPGQKMSKEQLRLLDALANQAALAVDAFQLRGQVMDSTRATDDYVRELELVWEIGQAITSRLELDDLVDALAEKLKTAVGAKTCTLVIYEPEVVGLTAVGHPKISRYQSVGEHVDQCDKLALMVAQRNEPLVVADVPNSCHCKYPDMVLEDGGTHHLLSVPISSRGFMGAINVFRQNAEPFGEKEKRLLMRLAPMVAAGIRNAELYEREKKIAQSLEKTFLPELEKELMGIQVGGGYQAAFDESMVGGDFYDVVDLGEGRYGIAIGDVAGKGLDAAVYTAMTRYMIQGFSADDTDPVQVVSKLNAALYRYTPAGKFVTLVYGILDTNANTFTYVNAGHEVPFVYRGKESELETLKSTGPAVGALTEMEYESAQAAFKPGDILIFYTDGATEVRSEGKFLGTEGLRKIISDQIRKNLDNLPEAILMGVKAYAKGHLRDDIAILVVKARTPGALF